MLLSRPSRRAAFYKRLLGYSYYDYPPMDSGRPTIYTERINASS